MGCAPSALPSESVDSYDDTSSGSDNLARNDTSSLASISEIPPFRERETSSFDSISEMPPQDIFDIAGDFLNENSATAGKTLNEIRKGSVGVFFDQDDVPEK